MDILANSIYSKYSFPKKKKKKNTTNQSMYSGCQTMIRMLYREYIIFQSYKYPLV